MINSDSSNTENSSIDSSEVCYMDPVTNLEEKMKPPSRDAIINWFKTSEIPREVGLDEDGNHAKWFHGKYIIWVYKYVRIQMCTIYYQNIFLSSRSYNSYRS